MDDQGFVMTIKFFSLISPISSPANYQIIFQNTCNVAKELTKKQGAQTHFLIDIRVLH